MNNSLADIWPEAYSEDFNPPIVTLYLTVDKHSGSKPKQ